jgi:hypothetical protein
LLQIDAVSIQNALECFLLANDLSSLPKQGDEAEHSENATEKKVNAEEVYMVSLLNFEGYHVSCVRRI